MAIDHDPRIFNRSVHHHFEIRFEDQADNKRYFYQLDGEGIRYEIVAFIKAIESGKGNYYISDRVSTSIADVVEKYYLRKYTII